MAISDKTHSSTSQQEFSKLQDMLHNGANEASSYLDSLKSKFSDYDNSHKSSKETATSYFQSAMDRARLSVDQFRQSGADIKNDGSDASNTYLDAAKRAMEQVGLAFDNLGKSAQAYDQHVHDSINAKVEDAKDESSKTAASWQDSISNLVSSTRDSTFHGFEALQDQFTAYKNSMAEHASAAADSVSNKASDVSEKLKPADSKINEQPTIADRATGAVSSGLEYVASAFEGATASSGKGTKKST